MKNLGSISPFLFRIPPEKNGDDIPAFLIKDEVDEKENDPEEFIHCRQCLASITHPDQRVKVNGSHLHTFANPHGIVFEIGCFRTAGGCSYAGEASEEFTWFSGFKWRFAFCGSCLRHLGWLFISPHTESFHGLILDQLIFPD